MAHIVAIPFPIPGHMNSLMHLCVNLATWFQVKITYAVPEGSRDFMIRSRDLAAAGIGDLNKVGQDHSAPQIEVVGLPGCPPLNFEVEDLLGTVKLMQSPLEALIEKLKTKGPVACILTDTFNGWVQDLANKFSVPRAVFWTASALNDVLHLHLPELQVKGFAPVTPENSNEEITFIPGIPSMLVKDIPLAFHTNQSKVTDIICDGSRRFPEAEFALSNTFEELEPEITAAFRKSVKSSYYPVGPCISRAFLAKQQQQNRSNHEGLTQQDRDCLSWLDKQTESSVVYVSFGSLAVMSAAKIKEVAMGLELSGQPFLLVNRNKMVAADEEESLKEFFTDFEQRNASRAKIVSWAPQMLILLHPAVAGFFTHCGWNSTLEGICAGVPMIAWPCMAEQNVNCRELVDQWKIALEVKNGSPNSVVPREVIAELVQRLLVGEEGKAMRARALELREAARAAVSEGGSSYMNLKAFVEAIKRSG